MLLLAAEGGHGETVVNEVVTTTSGAIGVAWLIPVLPLLGFCLVLLTTKPMRERAAFIAVGAAGLSFLLSVAVFFQVSADPATSVLRRWEIVVAEPDATPVLRLTVDFDDHGEPVDIEPPA